MDLTQIANVGVPAFIVIVGGYSAGKFLAAEIKEWRLWYTGEYWPSHKDSVEKQTALMVEIKSLITQMVLNLNSVREEIQDIKESQRHK